MSKTMPAPLPVVVEPDTGKNLYIDVIKSLINILQNAEA